MLYVIIICASHKNCTSRFKIVHFPPLFSRNWTAWINATTYKRIYTIHMYLIKTKSNIPYCPKKTKT